MLCHQTGDGAGERVVWDPLVVGQPYRQPRDGKAEVAISHELLSPTAADAAAEGQSVDGEGATDGVEKKGEHPPVEQAACRSQSLHPSLLCRCVATGLASLPFTALRPQMLPATCGISLE
eukprot:CAMPEP_0172078704 /NCGR_PEP_ID=MMETSP1043-20130122/17770_1 /TAXON_ID=464988 /ORGANISM="Hemiselmis andersenii, Strain CCMP441" /LENGTH=119 /DNA_ID=CAMNT_0012739815 /DNA_START=94 /DNA_END=450 /DNA_ORIENTATION=-